MLLFVNVAKFERSGQLLVACWNVDQHHPLTPSSAEEGKSKFPSFLRLVFTHIFGWTRGGRSQKLSPLPWGEGGERSEPGEGLLGYVGPSDPSAPCK